MIRKSTTKEDQDSKNDEKRRKKKKELSNKIIILLDKKTASVIRIRTKQSKFYPDCWQDKLGDDGRVVTLKQVKFCVKETVASSKE